MGFGEVSGDWAGWDGIGGVVHTHFRSSALCWCVFLGLIDAVRPEMGVAIAIEVSAKRAQWIGEHFRPTEVFSSL